MRNFVLAMQREMLGQGSTVKRTHLVGINLNNILKTHTSTKHDFLEMFHNFKREIMEAMDLKIITMMNISSPKTFFQEHQIFPRQMEPMPINVMALRTTANLQQKQRFPVRPTPNIAAPMEWKSAPHGIPVRY